MKEKANQMEKNGLISIFTLVEESKLLDFVELLEHRITDECLSVFNVDGSMRKTQKSKLLEKFMLKPIDYLPRQYISLIDMGFLWRLAIPSSEDREISHRSGKEYTWGDYAKKVVSLVSSRHPSASKVFCVNDVYNRDYTIKDDERDRRAMKDQNVPNVAMKADDKFPSNSRFKQNLLNSNNKVRLQHLIETKLREHCRETGKEVLQCTGLLSKNLLTDDMETEYAVNHAEADTVLLTLYNQLRQSGYSDTVIIDSEDTDVYVQAAYVSHDIDGNLLMKKKNAFYDCRSFLQSNISKIILPLHVMTGCDHNCVFYGRGKKTIMEKVEKYPEARRLLSACGETLPLQPAVFNDLKGFVLKYIYGCNETSCGGARAEQWKKMKKKSTLRLVPDNDTLEHICERANYLSYCQKNFQMKEHPSPIGNGWDIINGKCRPVRSRLPALPNSYDRVSVDSEYESSSEEEGFSEIESSSTDSESDIDSLNIVK